MRNAQQPRTPLVAGNWKMHKTYAEAVTLAQQVCDGLERRWKAGVEVLMCPPFTALRGVSNVIAFDHAWAKVGAQDCCWEGSGAFTGAVSVPMLADLDCAYCVVGHSERRTIFGEPDEVVARKAAACAAGGVCPIVCVGEDRAVYEAGQTVGFVRAQAAASLAGVDAARTGLVVAYEPLWAIGSGLTPTPEHAQQVAAAVREVVASCGCGVGADEVRVLYGGSVRAGNVAAFTACPDVDGVLVGGASLEATGFVDIVKAVVEQGNLV